jgi:hypothetical protein
MKEEIRAIKEKMKEEMKASQEGMKATVRVILQEMSWREETKACPEQQEGIQRKEIIVSSQKFPNKEASVETIRAMEDRSGDQQLAVGYQNPWKRRIKGHVIQGTPKEWTFRKRLRAQ